MEKQRNPLWFNILFFLSNLILYSVPLWVGFAVYDKYGPGMIAVFALFFYLLGLGSHMTKVVKAIIKNESI
jgi:hypothetical protein